MRSFVGRIGDLEYCTDTSRGIVRMMGILEQFVEVVVVEGSEIVVVVAVVKVE